MKGIRAVLLATSRAAAFATVLGILVRPALPADADPMSALAFYVGTWSCSDGSIGQPAHQGTWTFAMRGDLLTELIVIPKQGDLSSSSVTNATFAFDKKHDRYVETEMDNTAAWYVSVAQPAWKNVIHWRDIASWTQLSRWDMTRVDSDHFMVVAYPSATSTKPDYKGICERVPSAPRPGKGPPRMSRR